MTNIDRVTSKLLSVKEAYEILLKELKDEKKRWGKRSADITVWSNTNSGGSFEIKEVRMGRIQKENSSLDTDCLILEAAESKTIHVLHGRIKLRSSLEKGELLEFENRNWFHIERKK